MTAPLGLLGSTATGVVLLVLLAGCAAHLSRPAALPDALRAHRILPDRAAGPLAAAVTLAEGLLAAAGTAALLGRHRLGLTAVLAAAAALFTCYALYTRRALATGRGGPCGCSRTEVPLSGWVVGRAAAFALLALGGAVLAAGPGHPPVGGPETAVAGLTALTFAALLWVLPAAMTRPATPDRPAATVHPVDTARRARAGRPARAAGPVDLPHPATTTADGGPRPWTS